MNSTAIGTGRIPFQGRLNRTQRRQRLATAAMFLKSCVANSGVRRIFQWRGGSVTSHRDDVKITITYNYSSLEVLKCIVL